MSQLKEMSVAIDEFFRINDPESLDMPTLANFCATTIHRRSVIAVLDEIIDSPTLLDTVSATSYRVSPHFLKLLLYRDPSGWGVRIHSLDPGEDGPIQEPWHKHRWMLGSSVVKGTIVSDNAMTHLIPSTETSALPPDVMHQYALRDKRKVGSIQPRYEGPCILKDRFKARVPAGYSYSHHDSMAHRLIISEPTITAVLTSPDTRADATFIEPVPLTYTERPNPATLSPSETRLAILAVRSQLLQSHVPSLQTPSPSPFPERLSIAPQ